MTKQDGGAVIRRRGTGSRSRSTPAATPSPAAEGRAIVSSTLPEIGLSARVYYTAGDKDEELLAITDSKVVVFGRGNSGD
jgi:hypothetical protein